MTNEFYGFEDDMFSSSQKIDFHSFKNGEHKFRILPPYAPGKLFLQVDLHWGFTDENGRKKALKCTKWSHKSCPICDEVDRLKGQVELLKSTPSATPEQKKANDDMIMETEKRISEIRRKPTYLWNILTEEGQQKVLQLSWNGHEPLQTKVKFYWEQKKINVTAPTGNYLIYCSRTGQNAKTRYQYEVLENAVRQLDGLKPLVDLSKVYKETTPAELASVVSQGFVPLPETDPNDRDFTASMPTMEQHQQAQTQVQQPVQQAVQQTVAQQPVQQQVATQQLNNLAQSTAEQETENLMKMLQG